jgi:hypothetical protein
MHDEKGRFVNEEYKSRRKKRNLLLPPVTHYSRPSTMMSSFFILLLATTTCLSSAANIQRRAATQTYAPSGPQANNWKLLGCANDLYPNGRALNAGYSGTPNGGSMTISQCLSYCASQGTYLAGIEDGYQCFCGPKLDGGAALTQAAPLSASKNGDCTVACQADSTQNCGGKSSPFFSRLKS